MHKNRREPLHEISVGPHTPRCPTGGGGGDGVEGEGEAWDSFGRQHPKWHSSHGHSLEPTRINGSEGKSIVSSRSIRSILRHDASALGCCGHRLVDIPSRFQRLDAVEG